MTITRLFTIPFVGTVVQYIDGNNGGGTVTQSGTTGYLGASSIIFGDESAYKSVVATAQARQGFHFKHSYVDLADNPELITFTSGTTNVVRVRFDGYTWEALAGATSLATAHTPLAYNGRVNHWAACDVNIHASTGWVKFWIDGVAVIDYSGQTNQGAANFNRIGVGSVTNGVAWTGTFGCTVSNWYADDTTGEGAPAHPPPILLLPLRPNGNGNYAQWVGSDGNNTDNYLLVDETSPNTADYVTETLSGDRDSYAMETVAEAVHFGAINSVIGQVSALDDAGAGAQVAIFNRLGGTDADGSARTLTAAYLAYFERFTAKPGSGAWAWSDVPNIEMGVKIP